MKVNINVKVTLKGESSCWIFSRTAEKLTKFTSVLKLSKEARSQKVFASLGTFVMNQKGVLVFKVFIKQQLINFSSNITLYQKSLVRTTQKKTMSI
jgi:hypothetical protein